MWLKIMGSVLILISGVCLGFRQAAAFSARPRQLRQVISALTALNAQINYLASPLPDALVKCTAGLSGPVGRLLEKTGRLLNEKGYLTPKEAFFSAYAEEEESLAFLSPELEVFEILFANLGLADREEQQKSLSLIEYQLGKIQEEAQNLAAKNVKMYRYLGVCGALAAIIIFF